MRIRPWGFVAMLWFRFFLANNMLWQISISAISWSSYRPASTISPSNSFTRNMENERLSRFTRRDGKPLPPNVPSEAVIPLYLGMGADDFKLHDAHVLLSAFGESYCPSSEARRGEDCHTPLAARPPEAKFEPQPPLSYPAYIWGLAVAIWEILGMNALFSRICCTPKYVYQAMSHFGLKETTSISYTAMTAKVSRAEKSFSYSEYLKPFNIRDKAPS